MTGCLALVTETEDMAEAVTGTGAETAAEGLEAAVEADGSEIVEVGAGLEVAGTEVEAAA